MAPEWLKNAVFYEIYPQSFCSLDNKGVGTLNGIISKLDYICELGCNAIWLNPIYDSPFKDAGYDVRDYKKVASRYGSNSDARNLFVEAHKRGIHVILDLVPGHTSEEHPWFIESSKASHNEYSDRYIWTDSWFKGIPGRPYIGGETERNGTYMLNFFKCQPALNYGWTDPSEDWQSSVDSPEAIATREAIKDICRFWLDMGCDGFRVDMADSLVKGENAWPQTALVWKDILSDLRKCHPSAVFVSEWCYPYTSIVDAGFDMDFYLDHKGNGYNSLLRDYETDGPDMSYFRKDSHISCSKFINEWLPSYNAVKDHGFISLITGNHDTTRISYNLSSIELKIAFCFLLTMPGVPFIYYGDEIGMRYLDLPSYEGGYTRTGSRTPMQWDADTLSAGLNGKLYLPCDDSSDAPTVEKSRKIQDSLFNTVKNLIKLRLSEDSLSSDSPFDIVFLSDDSPLFIYRRKDLLIAINPSSEELSARLDSSGELSSGSESLRRRVLWSVGEGKIEDGIIRLKPQSFVIFK